MRTYLTSLLILFTLYCIGQEEFRQKLGHPKISHSIGIGLSNSLNSGVYEDRGGFVPGYYIPSIAYEYRKGRIGAVASIAWHQESSFGLFDSQTVTGDLEDRTEGHFNKIGIVQCGFRRYFDAGRWSPQIGVDLYFRRALYEYSGHNNGVNGNQYRKNILALSPNLTMAYRIHKNVGISACTAGGFALYNAHGLTGYNYVPASQDTKLYTTQIKASGFSTYFRIVSSISLFYRF